MKDFYTTLRGILSCVTLKPAPGRTLCAHTCIPTAVIHPFTHTCLSVQTHWALLKDYIKNAYWHTRKEVGPQSAEQLTHSHTKRLLFGCNLFSVHLCKYVKLERGVFVFVHLRSNCSSCFTLPPDTESPLHRKSRFHLSPVLCPVLLHIYMFWRKHDVTASICVYVNCKDLTSIFPQSSTINQWCREVCVLLCESYAQCALCSIWL